VTKAERILELYDGKRTTGEIARIVGTTDSYVRVVARQRKSGQSAIDARHYIKKFGGPTLKDANRIRARVARADPAYRARERELANYRYRVRKAKARAS
jgi:hypothetical protein